MSMIKYSIYVNIEIDSSFVLNHSYIYIYVLINGNLLVKYHQRGMKCPPEHMESIHHPMGRNQIGHERKSVW